MIGSRILHGLLLVALLLLIVLGLSWCHDRSRLRGAQKEASIAVATAKALDSVATQTPAIRQEQQEKQHAVDQIQGADQRLPDGFGSELERVRRGGQRHDPR